MRRTKMVLAVAGLMIAMLVVLAAPAMANDNHKNNNNRFFDNDRNNNRFFDNNDDDFRFLFFDNNDDDDFCDDFFDNCRFDRIDFNDGFGFGDFEQDADSGDVDQSFVITGGGDNSNQCANVQGVANTGNVRNQIGVSQFGDGFGDFDRDHRNRFFRDFDFDGFNDDFEFEDVGFDLTVNPNEDVDDVFTCDTQVNQAASAFGS